MHINAVIPVKAGIQRTTKTLVPVYTGMTNKEPWTGKIDFEPGSSQPVPNLTTHLLNYSTLFFRIPKISAGSGDEPL